MTYYFFYFIVLDGWFFLFSVTFIFRFYLLFLLIFTKHETTYIINLLYLLVRCSSIYNLLLFWVSQYVPYFFVIIISIIYFWRGEASWRG